MKILLPLATTTVAGPLQDRRGSATSGGTGGRCFPTARTTDPLPLPGPSAGFVRQVG